MDSLIDFNDCRTFLNDYEGADTKLKISLENEIYMLKLGRKLDDNERKLSVQASYSSSPVSEYIGCHAFSLAGIPVQETKLGTYNGHIVVAYKENHRQAEPLRLITYCTYLPSIHTSTQFEIKLSIVSGKRLQSIR